MKLPLAQSLLLLAASVAAFVELEAAEVTVVGSADSYIRSDSPNATGGGSDTLIVGQLAGSGSNDLRALLAFDFSGVSIPANATINSVQLVLTVKAYDGGSESTTVSLGLYEMTSDWTQSGASWNDAAASVPWTTPGGDYDSTLIASTDVPTKLVGNYTWESTNLLNIVSAALASSESASFLLKSVDESGTLRELLRFASTEGTASDAPRIVIDYTPIPEPSDSALLVSALGLGWAGSVVLRRRRGRMIA